MYFDETTLKMCEVCGKRNNILYEISKAPKVYTIGAFFDFSCTCICVFNNNLKFPFVFVVLAWEHTNESEDSIMATLGTIPT